MPIMAHHAHVRPAHCENLRRRLKPTNPAQDSFWLLEPAADAAMTYFYAQLFARDHYDLDPEVSQAV